ncbi:MAG: diguanylate cyclase [Spirochaetota bacterium]
MGLLERALQYKQKLNKDGKETLIDTIAGPAETEFIIKTDAFVLDNPSDFEDDSSVVTVEDSKENIPDVDIDGTDVDESASVSSSTETEVIETHDSAIEQESVEPDIVPESDNIDASFETNDAAPDPGEMQESDDEEEDLYPLPDMPYFDDYMVLFEIQKEFYQNESVEDVFGTILFSVMGQLGVSSASILFPLSDDMTKLVIIDSSGLNISDESLMWDINEGILANMTQSMNIIDVDDYKDDLLLREEYYRFISIDTKLLVPMFKDEQLIGVISIGEKINGEAFNETEKEFLKSLSQMAVNVIIFVDKFEKSEIERLALRNESEVLADVDYFQNSLVNVPGAESLLDIIRKNFYSLGLESYALFIKTEKDGYYPAFYEEKDLLQFSDSGFIIKHDNRLVSFLTKKNASIVVDNFTDSAVMSETFGSVRLEKMEQFIAYPFIIAGELTGFIAIFKINPAIELPEIDIRMRRISKFLVVYTNQIFQLERERDPYRDLTLDIYTKIEKEIQKADELDMPMTLLLFSVKNYKRFYDRFGQIETGFLFSKIERVIKSRLSTGDFSARIDRHKFIVVFPGKDKKFAATFSSIVKNEIVNDYGSHDFKLLISFIAAEYPGDGNDLYSLLDVLD